jgi:hypothetical protein
MITAHTATEFPNQEKELSNSFSGSYGSRGGPQDAKEVEAGYLNITKEQASKLLSTAIKAKNRQRRLKARRQRRWYRRNKASRAAEGRPARKPTAIEDVLAAGLA